MPESALLKQVQQKEVDKEKIAKRVAKKPELISELLNGLSAKKASIKYGCAKIIRIISEQQPKSLYPYINNFIDLLDNDNNILKWEGIYVLGNLAVVDENKAIDAILKKYLAPIPGPVLISAANVIGGAAKIAKAKPYLAERIVKEILKVKRANYKTAECRNVALGQAIESFDLFFEHIENKKPVIMLIKTQLKNSRNSTRKKAEKFIKKWQC